MASSSSSSLALAPINWSELLRGKILQLQRQLGALGRASLPPPPARWSLARQPLTARLAPTPRTVRPPTLLLSRDH